MGIIKAAITSIDGAMGDQWREYFYCDAMKSDVLACRGIKATGSRSANTSQNEVITEGSVIAVADGQCAIIVENGKVLEVFTKPGENVVNSQSAPSVFSGNARGVLKDIGRRIAFGGDAPPIRQRVYYINTKPCFNYPFATPGSGVPIRIRSTQVGLDMDMNVRCSGVYSFRISDPAVFYRKVCANFGGLVFYSQMENQMRREVESAVAKALVAVNDRGVRLSMLPEFVEILEQSMIEELNRQWAELRGITIDSLAIAVLDVSDKDSRMVQTDQRDGMFLGAGGANEAKTYQPNIRPVVTPKVNIPPVRIPPSTLTGAGPAKPAPTAALELWTCRCGARNRGKFCTECGRPKAEKVD